MSSKRMHSMLTGLALTILSGAASAIQIDVTISPPALVTQAPVVIERTVPVYREVPVYVDRHQHRYHRHYHRHHYRHDHYGRYHSRWRDRY